MGVFRGQISAQENQILTRARGLRSVVHFSPKYAHLKLKALREYQFNATFLRVITMGFSQQKSYLQQLLTLNQNKIAENILELNAPRNSDFDISKGATYRPESLGFTNKFNQLPCDSQTRRKRIELISRLVKKDARILLLGDDDLVSVQLAKENFKNIHVADCDRALLETIHQHSVKFTYPPTLHEANFTNQKPDFPPCQLILLDPANHIYSILDFSRVAINNQKNLKDALLMLMINPKLIGKKGMASVLNSMELAQYELIHLEPEFNTYPINTLQKITLHVFWFTHLRKRLKISFSKPMYFTSDCYLFKKNQGC